MVAATLAQLRFKFRFFPPGNELTKATAQELHRCDY
jgi:hypothetical protein